jgi:signal transduction histidine kinase/DNA-binding response OmpR family regulator
MSLRQTLLFGAGLGIFLPALVFTFFQFSSKRESEVDLRVRQPMQQYADVLASGLGTAIWNVDRFSATNLIDNVMRSPDVVGVTVTNEFGEVFAQKRNSSMTDVLVFRTQRDIPKGSSIVGQVVLEWSAQRVEHELWKEFIRQGTALAAQLGFSFAIIWLMLDKRLIQPLRDLMESTARLARGELDQDLRLQRQDEIGDLSQGLDTMRVDLARLIGERDRQNLALQNELIERQRMERELAQYRDNLEQQVVTRTQALNVALHQAESANRAKSVFLANMSHELRTPLNAILGFTQLMKRDNVAPENQKNLATINRAGQHLLALINDVLEISRIEAGRTLLQSEPFDLTEILTTVEEMIRVKADDKGLKFISEHATNLPAFVEGDGPHLKQILINLLGNAVKYTERGQLALRVSRRNGEINFEVSDTGPGISEQDHARIFQPFYQTQSGIAKGEGTGLGLAISQEYTKMMKGRLDVKSKIGQGSIFNLSLPLPETEAPIALAAARTITGLEKGSEEIRILIVDDKEDNRELVLQLLEPTGFELRTANDGKQAIDSFIEWQPHLIWMDMRMPILDGYQATQQIRALTGGDKVKIVALTASAFEEERQKIIASGCDDMVRKPLEEASLFSVMGNLLNLRYQYAEPVETPSQSQAEGLDFSVLPKVQLEALKAAAEELDLGKTREIVAALKMTHPALAVTVDEFAQEFRFDRIVDLCKTF